MIYIDYPGRLGNNLFQYAFGRILAEEHGHGMGVYAGEHADILTNCNEPIKQTNEFSNNLVQIKGHDINLSDIPMSDLRISGYFQRKEYYLAYTDKIKKWFWMPEHENEYGDNDVCLHVRRSDFGNNTIPLSFYSDILDKENFDNVYITGGINTPYGTDIDTSTIDYFAKYNPTYIEEDPVTAFRIMKKFKNVVQSTSTYCWWACFLSEHAEKIYTPLASFGYWSNERPEIDLIIEDKKYINIKI